MPMALLTSKTALLLLALASIAAADDSLAGATYSCVPAVMSLIPDTSGTCEAQTTRAGCLATIAPTATSPGFPESSTFGKFSCTWRASTAAVYVDEHYAYGDSNQEISFGIDVANFASPLTPKPCTVESKVTLRVPNRPTGITYYATQSVAMVGRIATASSCMAGQTSAGASMDCYSKITVPPVVDGWYAPVAVLYTSFQSMDTSGASKDLPALVTNTWKFVCNADHDDDRRRLARRLFSDYSLTAPWYRQVTGSQIVLGGANIEQFPLSFDTRFTPEWLVAGKIRSVDTARMKVKLLEGYKDKESSKDRVRGGRRGDYSAQPFLIAYLITAVNYDAFVDNFDTICSTTCAAPLSTAVATCIIPRGEKECKFTATGLDWNNEYMAVVSRPILGATPGENPVVLKFTVDTVINSALFVGPPPE